ncbi:hypothetical protein KOR42_41400 [Thalassoglobus neptunius]|uniref:Uncharacterized protein n=1 Tax=Thalassoglobus neptunius TaxID=1938619 RepID=A0A5C5WBX2_9PLAN|nr:hypothetical protein [Thalassoglobus neptunius]TWT47142.1 hypothetical protein KOR42_41400 [Thalassoglobus neptunius]
MTRHIVLTAVKISLAVLSVLALLSFRGVVAEATTSMFSPAAASDSDQLDRISSLGIGLYELVVVSTVIEFTVATRPRYPVLACTCFAIGIIFTTHISDVLLMTIENVAKVLQIPDVQLFSNENLRLALGALTVSLVTLVLLLACRRGFEKSPARHHQH